MEAIGLLLMIWLMHAGIALVLAAPVVYVGRRRVHWRTWELLAVAIPYLGWVVLMIWGSADKSMSNLIEPLLFAPAVPFAALCRVLAGRNLDERVTASGLIVALTASAAALYWFMPSLPD